MTTVLDTSSPTENDSQIQRKRIVAFFGFLLIVDWYLYFWNIGHFFQADSIFLLRYRPTSVFDLLRAFTRLHPSAWYRPLANDVLEGILFPIFGLNPIAYRIPVYILFFAVTVAVYVLAFTITRRRLTAAITTFFFTIHTTNAFITYDLGFLPELLFALFYIASVLAYLRHLERGNKSALLISLACFLASLLSKEAAVTLPGTLVALHLILGSRYEHDGPHRFWNTLTRSLSRVRGHILILICYLLFAFGYLHVMNVSFSTLFDSRPAETEAGSYHLVLDRGILENADVAMSWAFNIPNGWATDFRHLKPELVSALKAFRVLVLAVVAVLLIKGGRNTLFVGVAWFFLTLVPALPLFNHFLPYYLFLPVVGFSLLIGAALAFVYDKLSRVPLLAPGVVGAILVGVLYVCSVSIHADIRNHPLLGESSDLASSSLNSLKQLYPVLPPGAFIFVTDNQTPLWWHHESGGLIKMSYETEDVTVMFSSLRQNLPAEMSAENLILLRYENRLLIDDTASFRENQRRITNYRDPEGLTLSLSSSEVTAGDSYSVAIRGLHDASVLISYIVDAGPVKVFGAHLDQEGRASFDVSPGTRKGVYRFKGFNIPGQVDWFRADATITVR